MALPPSKLADIQYIPSTVGSIYANPVGVDSYVKGFAVFNVSGSPQTVKLHNVPDSTGSLGTAADANQCFEVVLASKEVLGWSWPGYGLPLTDTNDSFQASATNASSVTIVLFGSVV